MERLLMAIGEFVLTAFIFIIPALLVASFIYGWASFIQFIMFVFALGDFAIIGAMIHALVEL